MPLPRSSGSWLAAATGAEGDTLRLVAERRQNCDDDSDAAGDQRQRQTIVATEMRGDAGLVEQRRETDRGLPKIVVMPCSRSKSYTASLIVFIALPHDRYGSCLHAPVCLATAALIS